jgi:NhaP-type Na+/H+ or K+/H+ antiporter
VQGHEHLIQDLILIGALGIGAQWLAWALRVPAIVLLTLVGLAAGPVFGWLEPAADFGPLLRPLIAVAVALILFEGGFRASENSTCPPRVGVPGT